MIQNQLNSYRRHQGCFRRQSIKDTISISAGGLQTFGQDCTSTGYTFSDLFSHSFYTPWNASCDLLRVKTELYLKRVAGSHRSGIQGLFDLWIQDPGWTTGIILRESESLGTSFWVKILFLCGSRIRDGINTDPGWISHRLSVLLSIVCELKAIVKCCCLRLMEFMALTRAKFIINF